MSTPETARKTVNINFQLIFSQGINGILFLVSANFLIERLSNDQIWHVPLVFQISLKFLSCTSLSDGSVEACAISFVTNIFFFIHRLKCSFNRASSLPLIFLSRRFKILFSVSGVQYIFSFS